VEQLLAWEVYIKYDSTILEVVSRDVQMFLAANPGSSVFDASGAVPDSSGLYRAAAADTSDPPTPDSGSGVLCRLGLKAKAPGTSAVDLAILDIDDDTAPDIGPLLRNLDGEVLGDTNGDSIFDGPIENAQVVVDAPCPGGNSASGASSNDNGGTNPVLIAIAAAAGAIGLIGISLLALRRARRRTPHA
jgi:hypothetical protein